MCAHKQTHIALSSSPSQQPHPTRDGTHSSVLRVVVVRSIATSVGAAAEVRLVRPKLRERIRK